MTNDKYKQIGRNCDISSVKIAISVDMQFSWQPVWQLPVWQYLQKICSFVMDLDSE